MLCKSCGTELEQVGGIGEGAVGPDGVLPNTKPTCWCPNEGCDLYRKLGEIVGDEFTIID